MYILSTSSPRLRHHARRGTARYRSARVQRTTRRSTDRQLGVATHHAIDGNHRAFGKQRATSPARRPSLAHRPRPVGRRSVRPGGHQHHRVMISPTGSLPAAATTTRSALAPSRILARSPSVPIRETNDAPRGSAPALRGVWPSDRRRCCSRAALRRTCSSSVVAQRRPPLRPTPRERLASAQTSVSTDERGACSRASAPLRAHRQTEERARPTSLVQR